MHQQVLGLVGAQVARATIFFFFLGGGGGQVAPATVKGGQVAPAKGLGFRVFTFDTQRLDRLECGPYLALERPAAPPRSLAKLGRLRALKCW